MAARMVSATRVVQATPREIFSVLTDPSRHSELDGSGTVVRARDGSARLGNGSRFVMEMRLGPIPYRMTNRIVEFQDDRLIAWQHIGGHRWRYQLTPVEDGTATEVTESFDWSTARVPKAIELVGYPKRNLAAIEATLRRLADLVER